MNVKIIEKIYINFFYSKSLKSGIWYLENILIQMLDFHRKSLICISISKTL